MSVDEADRDDYPGKQVKLRRSDGFNELYKQTELRKESFIKEKEWKPPESNHVVDPSSQNQNDSIVRQNQMTIAEKIFERIKKTNDKIKTGRYKRFEFIKITPSFKALEIQV